MYVMYIDKYMVKQIVQNDTQMMTENTWLPFDYITTYRSIWCQVSHRAQTHIM